MSTDPKQRQERLNLLINELLHTIGQPLTALQMCILLRDRPLIDCGQLSTLMQDMGDQVSLLTYLFRTLRWVLDSEIEVACTESDLELVTQKLLPQWHQSALQRDITICVCGLQTAGPNSRRAFPLEPLEACLQEIMAAALESTPLRGSITIALTRRSGQTPCQLQISGGLLLSQSAALSRFGLTAATMLLNSSEQEFAYSLEPFQANLILLGPKGPVGDAPLLERPPSTLEGHAGLPR